MKSHKFNIGTKEALTVENQNRLDGLDDWWTYLLTNNLITAGFYGEPDDQGKRILHDIIKEDDWIFAYASGYGYIGVGLAKSTETYKLLNEPAPDSLSTHLHQRNVKWLYYVKLCDAIPANAIVKYPVSAREYMTDNDAEKLLRAFWEKPETVIKF